MRLHSIYIVCIILCAGLSIRTSRCPAKVTSPTPAKSVTQRISDRSFPSVFQAWNPADNLKDEDPLVTMARHDLVFGGIGPKWDHKYIGLATGFTPESIVQALKTRKQLLKLNPNIILLDEIRYRDAHPRFLPDEHEWWRRNANGVRVPGWDEGGYIQLDFTNPQYRHQVAKRALAAMQSGVFDGIMLDWWHDDNDRLALIKTIRQYIGDEPLILANANDRTTPRTAPYINGYFMECFRSRTPEHWHRIAETLAWAEKNLREPRINCLETWYHNSREDFNLMRATTTLALTISDGYCLFSDPNPLRSPDHLHNWYDFWDHDLGRPLSPGKKRADGTIVRQFINGTAVYNPMGNGPVSVSFRDVRKSAATGTLATTHTVDGGDGDLFLK